MCVCIYIYVCVCICIHTYTHTYRQTDRNQTDRISDGQTDRQTDLPSYIQTYTHTHYLYLYIYIYFFLLFIYKTRGCGKVALGVPGFPEPGGPRKSKKNWRGRLRDQNRVGLNPRVRV